MNAPLPSAAEDYDDYYDAAKKDGEEFIQGRHGGTIHANPSATERRIDLRETPEEKADRRRFTGERITAMGEFDALLPTDSLPERMARIWPRSLLSDVKREEIAADARGEDLWRMQGGRDEA